MRLRRWSAGVPAGRSRSRSRRKFSRVRHEIARSGGVFAVPGAVRCCLLAGRDAEVLEGGGLQLGGGGQAGEGGWAVGDLDGVARQRAEVLEQVLEAVGGLPVGGACAGGLGGGLG